MRSHHFLLALLVLPFLLIGCGSSQNPTTTTSDANASSVASADVVVTAPAPSDLITSPVTVTGQARGTWYSEGSFPVRIVDTQGAQVGIGIAEAQGEWMTTDFVPFTATITFVTDAADGSIVLEKDNPSGEPENDAQVTVPVRFAP